MSIESQEFTPPGGSKPLAFSGHRLTLPAELEDGKIPDRISNLSQYICLIIFLALVWAAFAEIRERVVASGEIIPSGRVQQIEHLEGGEVEKVVAIEGQIVNPGDILMHLRPLAVTSDLNQLRVRAVGLEMQQKALTAVLKGTEPDFGEDAENYPEIAADQLQVFQTKRAHLEQNHRALAARVSQKEAEVKSLELEVQSLERQKAIQQEQLEIREKLLKDGYTSRRAYLTTKTALEEAAAKHMVTAGRLGIVRQELIEARSNMRAQTAEAKKKLSEERSTVTTELAELGQQLEKHRDRVHRTDVRSPIHGIVQELVQSAAGEVVKPGDLIAKVVPVNQQIVAEVKVDPRDIGHIVEGDPAEIKLSTFDPSIFGVAKGEVQHLSATTFTDEDGQPYYKAVVKLDEGHIGTGSKKRLILPGMVVEADIITGHKSLVKYLLAPVYRSLDRAFSER